MMPGASENLARAIEQAGGLLGKQDIARVLSVSRQRVGQIIEDHPDFPEPVAHVSVPGRTIPVWLGSDVDAWQRRRTERLRKRRQRGTPQSRIRT